MGRNPTLSKPVLSPEAALFAKRSYEGLAIRLAKRR